MRPMVRRLLLLVGGSAFFAITLFGLNPQHDDGIVGMTRKNGNGCTCHSFAPTSSVHVWITGPSLVVAGSTNIYSLWMTGGPAVSGGFNVAAAAGTLMAIDSGAKIIAGELTHAAPKPFTHDTVSWVFAYHAPAASGFDTVYSVAQSVNGNDIPDSGDQWNFGDNFLIHVLPPSSLVPALTEWGAAILIVGFIVAGILALHRRKIIAPSG